MFLKMDIRKYFSKKRPREDESQDDDTDIDVLPTHGCSTNVTEGCSTNLTEGCSSNLTAKALKKVYKSKLTYCCQWESKYPWVYCEDPEKGMFCQICQKFGKPPATARGAWTSRGISDWNHGTEVLKAHNDSKSHKDAALAARMAEQPSVLELQQAADAQHVSELRANNRAILWKLLRSVYFLVKHRIPHTTTFQNLLALQVANGDKLLEKHLTEGPGNAQNTSKFSIVALIEAIVTWIDENL